MCGIERSVAPAAASIAKQVVILDTARGAAAFTFFYIFVVDARVAHQFGFSVDAACDPIRLLAGIAFRGDSIVAVDRVCVPIESASVGSSARRRHREGVPIAQEHRLLVEGAGVCAQFLTRVTNLAKSRIAIEMTIGCYGAPVGSPAVAPKVEPPTLA
jgi:hypothetical protein